MPGPFDDLIGELQPGQKGWLPLDEAGNPTGPATLHPPQAPALACAVQANAKNPLTDDDHALLSDTGAPLEAPLNPHADFRLPGSGGEYPEVDVAPVINSLTPNTAPANDPTDVNMVVEGSGFTPQSTIVFNGYDEPTTYISETQVSTIVKPSIFEVAAVCPVLVRNGTEESDPLDFTFTDPVAGRRGGSRK